MRATSKKARFVPKAILLASALLTAMVVLTTLPTTAYAETTPDETSEVVESPGAPAATTSSADHSIVWVWTTPASGLTPDAPTDPVETIPVYRPTDIIQFGYELSRQGVVVTSGTIDSVVLTLNTPVVEDGGYTLEMWSITRAEVVSPSVLGNMTVVTPVVELHTLPPIQEESIPGPIDTAPLHRAALVAPTPIAASLNSSEASSDGSVLSAEDTSNPATSITDLAVAQPTHEGWVVLGMSWYIWLLILAGLFAIGRWIMPRVYHRR